MNRKPLWFPFLTSAIMLIIFLNASTLPAQIPTRSNDLVSEFTTIWSNMPGRDSEGFDVPTSGELANWRILIQMLLDENWNGAHSYVQANFPAYTLYEFTDTGNNNAVYYLLEENTPISKGWGTYVFATTYQRQMVIEAPHPKYEINTYSESPNIFRLTDSRYLMMAGTHRCANSQNSGCDGISSACDGEPVKISDVAHSVDTPFHVTHEEIVLFNSQTYQVQLHGQTGCEDIFLSNGNATIVTTKLIDLRDEILAQGGLSCEVAGQSSCSLVAEDNVQGRFTNGSTNDPCNTPASGQNITEYFIHAEQTRTVRDNYSEYSKLANALNIVIPTTGTNQYTLAVTTTGNGSVDLAPPGGIYNEGTVVTLTATEDPGWEFDSWSGDLTGTANPETITMDANKNVTAIFIPVLQYTLNVTPDGSGSVDLAPPGGVYNEGTVVTLTATEDPGWTFDSWSGDLTGSVNPETITMDANKNVTATFMEMGLPHATLPYNTGFESGSLDQYWTTQTSDPAGRIQVSAAFSPHSGGFHLLMDVSVKNVYSTNEAWLHLNLSGETQVDMTFWWTEFDDEDHPEDGVFFSDNGGASFVKTYSLTGGGAYSQINLDVDQLASMNGLSLTSTFIIKFQQRDNDKLKKDGFGFDDISVTSGLAKHLVDESVTSSMPTTAFLFQAYPNPFNPETNISFTLPNTEVVRIYIYTNYGQLVRRLVTDEMLKTGRHTYCWDGRDDHGNKIPSGLYLIRMNVGSFQAVQKVMLLK